ncbi:MAG: elongation factor Tu [Euryarchaeota archaeon]|nr:elongation factor Tu [Euryarchaeota archaeon]
MKGLTIALLGDPALGPLLAKKGTESDLRFFNLKREQGAITFIEPARYPDKVQPLIQALAMADAAILSVDKIDRFLGEQIIAIDSIGLERGFIILNNYMQMDEVAPFLKGTPLSGWPVLGRDANKVNDALLAMDIPAKDGPVKVPVDHFFNVKGVGTVVLGCVRRGTVRQHGELEAYPTGKNALVRSIQVHDSDVPEAGFGNRVGLALKNIDVADLDRGHVLAPSGSLLASQSLKLELRASRFWKGELREGAIVHCSSGLQIVPARVRDADGGSLKGGATGCATFSFERPLVHEKGERILVLDLDSKGLRVVCWGVSSG